MERQILCHYYFIRGTRVIIQKYKHDDAILELNTFQSWRYNLLATLGYFGSAKMLIKSEYWASLVAQWLRVHLLVRGTRVRALVWEDPTCHGAAGPVSHNYWACVSGACAPQRERPRWWEARAPRWGVAPTCHSWRKPSHRNEDPTQPK